MTKRPPLRTNIGRVIAALIFVILALVALFAVGVIMSSKLSENSSEGVYGPFIVAGSICVTIVIALPFIAIAWPILHFGRGGFLSFVCTGLVLGAALAGTAGLVLERMSSTAQMPLAGILAAIGAAPLALLMSAIRLIAYPRRLQMPPTSDAASALPPLPVMAN